MTEPWQSARGPGNALLPVDQHKKGKEEESGFLLAFLATMPKK